MLLVPRKAGQTGEQGLGIMSQGGAKAALD